MSEAASQSYPTMATLKGGPLRGNGIQRELEVLFAETATLAKQLTQAARRIHREGDLPSGGRSVLQRLDQHGPQTVPQLARARLTSRQGTQMLVNRLEAGGAVEFASNPAHKRSDVVRLTEPGKQLLDTATHREASFLAPLSDISGAELQSATGLLRKIRGLLASHREGGAEVTVKAKSRKPASRRKAQQSIEPQKVGRPTAVPAPGATSQPVSEDGEFPVNLL